MMAIDYFCGAGGASLGLTAAGYRVAGYDNWDVAVATHNAGGLVAHLHDLSNAMLDDCLPHFPPVAWFSPPCPPFSEAGKGTGHIDPRDGFPWALRIIRETRPWVVFIENVKGLTSKRHLWYLESVLTALRTYGYQTEWRLLNAADYGVPQTRQRCFIVARRDRQEVRWPEPTHTKEQWVSMATALGQVPTGWALNTGRDWKKGGSRDDAQRISFDDPSPTVTAIAQSQWQVRATGCAPVHLSVADVARLQDFPACWPWQGTKAQQCRQIGNGVPPRMARLLVEVNR